jgi:hypothetical protein
MTDICILYEELKHLRKENARFKREQRGDARTAPPMLRCA